MDLAFPTPWPSFSPLVGVRECLESLSCESAETAQDRAEQAHHNRVRRTRQRPARPCLLTPWVTGVVPKADRASRLRPQLNAVRNAHSDSVPFGKARADTEEEHAGAHGAAHAQRERTLAHARPSFFVICVPMGAAFAAHPARRWPPAQPPLYELLTAPPPFVRWTLRVTTHTCARTLTQPTAAADPAARQAAVAADPV